MADALHGETRLRRRAAARIACVLCLVFAVCVAPGAMAQDTGAARLGTEQERASSLVREVAGVVERIVQDPGSAMLLRRARGILVFPRYARIAAGIGMQGGEGLLMTRDADGAVAGPAFYRLAGIGFGVQAGYAAGDLAVLLMTERAVQRFRSGADASLTIDFAGVAGPWSGRELASTGQIQDAVAWSDTGGLFAGVSAGLLQVRVDEDANHAYYGRTDATPVLILSGRLQDGRARVLVDGLRRKAPADAGSGRAEGN